MGKQGDQVIAAAEGMFDEPILAAAFAKPRGSTTAVASGAGAAAAIGRNWASGHAGRAGEAGIVLGDPGALVLTASRFITLEVGVSLMGKINAVKEVKSEVPLSAIDAVEVKRMGMAGVMEITSGGTAFKVEGKVDDLRDFEGAFAAARGAAGV